MLFQRTQDVIKARYAGTCPTCSGKIVIGEDIHYGKHGWQHVTCPVVTAPVTAPVPVTTAPVGIQVPDGKYTIVGIKDEDGEWTRRTLRVRTQSIHAPFAPGRTIIGYLTGTDNDTAYTAVAFLENGVVRYFSRYAGIEQIAIVKQAIDVLVHPKDHLEQLEAYAMESGTCWRCGKTLTVPASLHRGTGPTCAKKLGL
jgi:hypothetical protein